MRIAAGMAALMLCILWGKSKAAVLYMRQKILHGFSEDILKLACEMDYRPRDMRIMAESLVSGETGDFWRSYISGMEGGSTAELAWREAVENYGGFSVLTHDERQLIGETGRSIGMLNAKDGTETLKHKAAQAEKRADELKVQLESKGAVYQKLGLLGGIAMLLAVV